MNETRLEYLHELLVLHRREYEKAIKPIIDEMVQIHVQSTPTFLVTPEEVARLLAMPSVFVERETP